jgi:hypothetical protein
MWRPIRGEALFYVPDLTNYDERVEKIVVIVLISVGGRG